MFRRLTVNIIVAFLATWQAMAGASVDVYILTGQSNSLGTTAGELGDYTPDTHPADFLTNFWWNNVSGDAGTYPPVSFGSSGNNFQNLQMQQGGIGNPYWWGPEFGFARTLYDAGRTNFVIIKASQSGGGNTLWDKATFDISNPNAPMWGHVSNTVMLALAKLTSSGKTFKIRGLLYQQGEGNAIQEARIADSRFGLLMTNLMNSINTVYPGTAESMHGVMAEIGASQTGGVTFTVTTSNQLAFAYTNDAVAFVMTHDLLNSIHFHKPGKLEIGMRMADCFLGRPIMSDIGFNGVTNRPNATSVIFEQYVPDPNGTNNGVILNVPNTFTGFADGTNGQPPAGLLVNGSSGNVVFANFHTNVTSDIVCGQNNYTNNGFPADWTDSGAAVTFNFVDPTNRTPAAFVSAFAFELVSPKTTNNVMVSMFDGRGDPIFNTGVLTSGRYGYQAHDPFSEAITSAVAVVKIQGSTNTIWSIGHITDNGVPDLAWNDLRLPTPYELWSFQIADPTFRDASADADGDGVANLMEYAMGTSPTNKTSFAKLQGLWTNGSFVVQFPRANLNDLTWYVDRATSLSNAAWEVIATNPGGAGWTGPATVQESDNGTGKNVLVTDPDTASSEHYIRVRVTQP